MTKINQLELKKTQLNQWIRKQAEKMGFDLVGIVPADPPKLIDRYREWLNLGYAGEMEYLHRHFPLKQDPKNLLPEVKRASQKLFYCIHTDNQLKLQHLLIFSVQLLSFH